MLKLIFSDLDDTLLDSKKMVSKKTMNFIKGLKDTCFIVNSGRLPYNMDPIKQYIDLSNMVCGNGSYVVVDGKLIYSCCLDKKDAYDLLDYGYSRGYLPRLYLDSGLYITENSNMPTSVKINMVTKDELYELLEKEYVYKIAFSDYNKDH